ncbi:MULTISPECIES: hypothetical protein [unclassified Leptospira]|uniref:hypothetical protein n=1 Tax=unclassified Leptospira TaxID=2633828 RepID=UPI0002BD650F|nr:MULTISPECIES: hypothetical protein [unclassified Leptospira]EMJ97796.1 hypothetical protein LEP1GSC192_3137 [Leptospira sp. B5-022]MCR1795855.1 hypothetical protein [Leptospira sp. id769339]
MNHSEFINFTRQVLLSWTQAFDLAESARKMLDPRCTGDTNKAWAEGPFLTSPADFPEIVHSHPYVLRTSLYSSKAAELIMGRNPPKEENGGVKIPYQSYDPEVVIAHSMIILTYSALEEYEFSNISEAILSNVESFDNEKFNLRDFKDKGLERLKKGRAEYHFKQYKSQPVKTRICDWQKFNIAQLEDRMQKKYIELSDFRNKMAHTNSLNESKIKTAIEYYYFAYSISVRMAEIFADESGLPLLNDAKLFTEEDEKLIWDKVLFVSP